MIRTVLFDMGNVLVSYSPAAFAAALCPGSPDDQQMLLREVSGSADWVRIDRGDLAEEEAFGLFRKRLPERLHAAAGGMLFGWERFSAVLPGIPELLSDLQEAGYTLCLLTNAGKRHHSYWPSFGLAPFFGDRILLSADWHVLKPERAYFETARSVLGLDFSECVFIDDSALNVESAGRCGLDGIVFFGDVQRLRAELAARGVRIPLQGPALTV